MFSERRSSFPVPLDGDEDEIKCVTVQELKELNTLIASDKAEYQRLVNK